ncbi:hypothetical protein GCM10011371_18250 [Novosphingobium marinum]|nr:hypothetical protein GCM10011371_18250 [Novosphingobium marinum]
MSKVGETKRPSLMPYGSRESAGLVAKVGIVKSPALRPYGSEEKVRLVSKVGDPKAAVSQDGTRRIIRLNKAR